MFRAAEDDLRIGMKETVAGGHLPVPPDDGRLFLDEIAVTLGSKGKFGQLQQKSPILARLQIDLVKLLRQVDASVIGNEVREDLAGGEKVGEDHRLDFEIREKIRQLRQLMIVLLCDDGLHADVGKIASPLVFQVPETL